MLHQQRSTTPPQQHKTKPSWWMSCPTTVIRMAPSILPRSRGTPVSSATPTSTPTATPYVITENKDDSDKSHKQTEPQRQQHEDTNQGGRDDVHTEGQVRNVEQSADGKSLLVTITLGPGGSE